MRLTRIFTDASLSVEKNTIPLNTEQHHYLKNVIRMRPGDLFLLFNGKDGEWVAKFEGSTAILMRRQHDQSSAYEYKIILCFCVPKPKALRNIIRQATELGVDKIQPIHSSRVENKLKDTEKLRSWAIEAAQQSNRLSIPEIAMPIDFPSIEHNYQNLFICDETLCKKEESLRIPLADSYVVIVGPEGGFSDEELTINANKISLGKTILRADTAVVAALSKIRFTHEANR